METRNSSHRSVAKLQTDNWDTIPSLPIQPRSPEGDVSELPRSGRKQYQEQEAQKNPVKAVGNTCQLSNRH